MRKKTKKNTGVAERHCLSIIPLCISGKCVLADFKIDTGQIDGQDTGQNDGSIPTNRDKTTDQTADLLEMNRKENRESTPLPAKRQAKALIERITPPITQMTGQEFQERRRRQIKALMESPNQVMA